MQKWMVSCVDGTTEAEGVSWLGAIADAVNKLGMKPGVLAQMVCEVDSGRKAQHCAVVARFNPIRAGS